MTTRRQRRDFVRLNPDYAWQAEQQGLGRFRPTALSRELAEADPTTRTAEEPEPLGRRLPQPLDAGRQGVER